MGVEMAANLVAAGHDVVVWNRTIDKARDFAAQHRCGVAETPAELAQAVDIVVTMLADDASSEAVHLGDAGLFTAPRATVFLQMGTLSPDHVAALAHAAPPGCRVIDAPVSGATGAARAATLTIMAGWSEAEAAPLRPVLEAMGHPVLCLGSVGAGAVMKLAVNSMIHGLNQSLAEALTLAEAAGIAPERAFDVIENSAAAAPMLSYRRPLYLDETSHDVTFTVALARKDMDLTAALAKGFGVAMPQGGVTLDNLKEAEAAGYATRDMASILTFMREKLP
jgi:3-hydroxyisobutyrate dehydrogenase-like beta-hydroxyacid dehydrogenase